MPNGLSARRELRMTLLPGEAAGDTRRGARSSVAIRTHAADSGATPADPDPAVRAIGERRGAPQDAAAHYANAGPDCYWPEAG